MGGLAALFCPECAIPLYEICDTRTAIYCGRINGWIIAVLISVVVVGFGIFLTISLARDVGTGAAIATAIGIVVVLALALTLIPRFSGWLAGAEHRGYASRIMQ